MSDVRLIPLGVGGAFTSLYYTTCMALGLGDDWILIDCPHPIRKLIRAEFTKPRAGAKGLRLHELARQIVNAVIEKGECDFVAEVAGEMPSYVIAELMGMPLDDGRELYRHTETIHSAPEALPEGAIPRAVMAMFAYATDLIAKKRANPGDDLATRLLQTEVEGRRLTDPEFLLFFLLLIDAGGDTTRNLLSTGLLALTQNPEKKAWLMADLNARLDGAREELLRWASPVIYMRRRATRTTGDDPRNGPRCAQHAAGLPLRATLPISAGAVRTGTTGAAPARDPQDQPQSRLPACIRRTCDTGMRRWIADRGARCPQGGLAGLTGRDNSAPLFAGQFTSRRSGGRLVLQGFALRLSS